MEGDLEDALEEVLEEGGFGETLGGYWREGDLVGDTKGRLEGVNSEVLPFF